MYLLCTLTALNRTGTRSGQIYLMYFDVQVYIRFMHTSVFGFFFKNLFIVLTRTKEREKTNVTVFKKFQRLTDGAGIQ